MRRPLLLIQTGEAPDVLVPRFGGFADWFRAAMRVDPARVHVVRVDAGESLPEPVAQRPGRPRKQKAVRDGGMIERGIDGIAMRVGRGADTNTVAAVIRALKATS